MTNCRLKLILYPAGARGDFVSGWAGVLPNVMNNWWSIDPITGLSLGMFQIKMIDHGFPLEEILKNQNLFLDANSKLFCVGACHGSNLDLASLQKLIDSGALQLYVIDVTTADKADIAWECIVKSYLSRRNYYKETQWIWAIDQKLDSSNSEITDQQRIDAVTDLAQKISITAIEKFLTSTDITILDYTKLFVPGGSYYLCDKLKLSAPQVCHDFWNQMLPFACSPDSINVWNHTWQKKDFLNSKRKALYSIQKENGTLVHSQ